jgi:AcrR family transcriptional regulator
MSRSLLHKTAQEFARDLNRYFDRIAQLLSIITRGRIQAPKFHVVDTSLENVDARLAKLDDAKANLTDALEAIEAIKLASIQNKEDLEVALSQLDSLREKKMDLEQELNEIRTVAQSDISAFRQTVGLPSKSDILRERIVGFTSGLFASLLAWAVIWGISHLVQLAT